MTHALQDIYELVKERLASGDETYREALDHIEAAMKADGVTPEEAQPELPLED